MSHAREEKQPQLQLADLPLPEAARDLDTDEAEQVRGGGSPLLPPAMGPIAAGTGRTESGMIGDTRTVISAEAASTPGGLR